ncbi:lipid A deacylase LpxR family protein [uncultured Methylibium sp.]|uniref:lipid A deacylase LpxR family protein n=1 Tax=uncultured Methylibium sp. TaxID=381093 RepID=UPI0025CC26F1|nr:lipid A deacylase LpxR family protein [uncultured Methylibium sp.]
MKHALARLILAGGVAGLPSIAALAAPEPTGDSRLQGSFFAIENDYLGRTKVHTDRWYTNGLLYARSYQRDKPPALLAAALELGRRQFGLLADTEGPTTTLFFGQNIYTPSDIERVDQQVFDRPWGGWLFAGTGLSLFDGPRHRSVEVKLGVVGPASMAEQVQRGFHKIIKDDDPAGWRNQLRPRLGLQASYMVTHRLTDADLGFLPNWAGVHGHARATLGTVKTLGALGLTLVAGERDRVFGAPDEGDYLAADFSERAASPLKLPLLGWPTTLFLQAQWSAVAYNHFVTGRTYGEPQPQIELKRSNLMMTLGFSVQIRERYRLEYRVKRRTPEFSVPGQARDDGYHSYGELRLVCATN